MHGLLGFAVFMIILVPFFLFGIIMRTGRHIFGAWKSSHTAFPPWTRRGAVTEPSEVFRAPRGGRSPEARVFALARSLGGRLTVSDVIIELGLDVKDAEELLEGLVDNIRVRMEFDDNGRVTYEFPEIIDRLNGNG